MPGQTASRARRPVPPAGVSALVEARRSRTGFPRLWATFAMAVALLAAYAGSAFAQNQTITGDLIRVEVSATARPDVRVKPSTASAPGDPYVHQYYGFNAWDNLLWLDGGAAGKFTSGYLMWFPGNTLVTPVSNTLEPVPGGERIVTVVDLGATGLRMTQTITYLQGTRYIVKDWVFSNTGETTFTDLRFFHGGDTYFGGEDSAYSFYDPAKSMVYLRNSDTANWGVMGYYANPATPATRYFSGNYWTGNTQAGETGALSNTVDASFVDAGYYLQWNRASFEPGETWAIQAFEVWTPAGNIQVLAPADQNVAPDTTVTLPFTVQNLGTAATDVTVTAAASAIGWTAQVVGAATRLVDANDSVTVNVQVVVPAGASGSSDVTLSADGGVPASAGSTLTVIDLDLLVDPGAIDFGSVTPGSSAPARTVTVTNAGTTPATLGTVATSAPFVLASDLCSGVTLTAAATCTVGVAFAPSAEGTFATALNVPVLAPELLTRTVSLEGRAQSVTAPSVTTAAVTGVTAASASSGGVVTSDGGTAVTARGVCWATAPSPTTADTCTADGAGTGAFTSALAGLAPATAYHVRAYASNAEGTSYGADETFATPALPPTISAIDPASGPVAGGTLVTVSGTGFEPGALLRIGGRAAASVVVVSATTVEAIAPEGDNGAADVEIINPDAQSATLAGGFTYEPPARPYYFAEGATGPFFDTALTVFNPNAVVTPVTFTFMKDDGTHVALARLVGPWASVVVSVDEIAGLEDASFAVVVESTSADPLVVERSMTWGEGRGGHAAVAADAMSTSWYFAEGVQSASFDTFLLVGNPGSTEAVVEISFLPEGGTPVVWTVDVAPRSRATVWAGAVPGLGERAFSTVITSSVPVVAERSTYFNTDRPWGGGTSTVGASSPSDVWYFAEGAGLPVFDTFLLIGNPSASPATVRLTWFFDDGSTHEAVYQVDRHSRRSVWVNAEWPDVAARGPFGVVVAADRPVVAERAMYWTANAVWREGHTTPGSPVTARRWLVAPVRVGGPESQQAYLLLANPHEEPAAVEVTYRSAAGDVVAVETHVVAPESRLSLWMNGVLGSEATQQLGAVVDVVGGPRVVVERATYWNAGDAWWAGGSVVVATPVQEEK